LPIRFPYIASELFATESNALIDSLFKEVTIEDSKDPYLNLLDTIDFVQVDGKNENEKDSIKFDEEDPIMSKNNKNLEGTTKENDEINEFGLEERNMKKIDLTLENIFAKENEGDTDSYLGFLFYFSFISQVFGP
jgi:hypothetical protein